MATAEAALDIVVDRRDTGQIFPVPRNFRWGIEIPLTFGLLRSAGFSLLYSHTALEEYRRRSQTYQLNYGAFIAGPRRLSQSFWRLFLKQIRLCCLIVRIAL